MSKRRSSPGKPAKGEPQEVEAEGTEEATDPGAELALGSAEATLPAGEDEDGAIDAEAEWLEEVPTREREGGVVALRPSDAHDEGASRGSSMVRHDPMSAYLAELRKHPLLTREEEHELAVMWFEAKDVHAARRLVTANLRLVVKIAHEYRRAYGTLLDLVQEGNVGLVQAVQKYDPYRGVKLSTYAAWWIRAYILKFILNNWRLVKVGTTQAQRKLFFNLNKERERLSREGFVPDAKLLAERLDVTEAEVTEMEQRLRASDMSLDAPVGGQSEEAGPSHLDYLEGGDRPDTSVEANEFAKLLREKLQVFGATLEGREKTLFDERLLAESPLTLHEIGEKYGISRERARQLEKRLTDKLRDYLQAELGEAIDVAAGRE